MTPNLHQKWVSLSPHMLPTQVVLNFPVWIKQADTYSLRLLPGSICSDTVLQNIDQVYVSQEHAPYLAFYQDSRNWGVVKQGVFEHFMLDQFHAILFRVFYMKKVDNYTFLTLYDFLDRFRFWFIQDINQDVKRWIHTTLDWSPILRYRVDSALAAWVLGQKLGYSSFYDLVDFFLGGLLCDVGHFTGYDTFEAFNAADPESWFYDPGHPSASIEMVRGVEDLGLTVRQTIERHHECVDGSGFPKGVSGSGAVPEQAQGIGLVSEYVFCVAFGGQGRFGVDTVRLSQSRFLKHRAKYASDVFSNFIEVMHDLYH